MYSMLVMMTMGTTPNYVECHPTTCAPAPIVACAPAPVYDPCAMPKKKCGLFGGGLFSGGLCKKPAPCAAPCPAPVVYAPPPPPPCAPVACDPCAPKKKCGLFGGGLFSGGLCKKKTCEPAPVYVSAPCAPVMYPAPAPVPPAPVPPANMPK